MHTLPVRWDGNPIPLTPGLYSAGVETIVETVSTSAGRYGTQTDSYNLNSQMPLTLKWHLLSGQKDKKVGTEKWHRKWHRTNSCELQEFKHFQPFLYTFID